MKKFILTIFLLSAVSALAQLPPVIRNAYDTNTTAAVDNRVLSLVVNPTNGVTLSQLRALGFLTNGATFGVDLRGGLVVTFPSGYWVYDTDPSSGGFIFAGAGDTGTNIFIMGNNGVFTAPYYFGDGSGLFNLNVTNSFTNGIPQTLITGSPTIDTTKIGLMGITTLGDSNIATLPVISSPFPTNRIAPILLKVPGLWGSTNLFLPLVYTNQP